MTDTVEERFEKQSSIKISRTAKGDYTWEIKRYYNEDKEDWREVNNIIQDIDKNLKERFHA